MGLAAATHLKQGICFMLGLMLSLLLRVCHSLLQITLQACEGVVVQVTHVHSAGLLDEVGHVRIHLGVGECRLSNGPGHVGIR